MKQYIKDFKKFSLNEEMDLDTEEITIETGENNGNALESYKQILDESGWGYIEGPEGGPEMYIWPNVENIGDSSVQIVLNPNKGTFIASSNEESGTEKPMTLENIEGFRRGVKAAMRLEELDNI
jgi:hypothetical protein